ncbi:MAG: tetratricopeptide repeat protein [Burkholderiales bacterium]|nr:tetratricopeptide repeat protein [Anaerolineae bacterium]
MRELANKLMMRDQQPVSTQPDVISDVLFGSSRNMLSQLYVNRFRLRIGLWPIVSDSDPEIALGIASVLGFLLERWQDIRVYRLFADVDGEPEDYEWSLPDSQFSVDDWQLEELDENVAMWGTLSHSEQQWQLQIEVESDLSDVEETQRFNITAPTLTALVNQLPQISGDLATYLDVGQKRLFAPTYTIDETDDERITSLLKQSFRWELRLFLSLWGQEWSEQDVLSQLNDMLDTGTTMTGDFGAYIAAHTIARVLPFLPEEQSDALANRIDKFVEVFGSTDFTAIVISDALYDAGYTREATELLEANLKAFPEDPKAWLAMAELHWRAGRLPEALDTFQQAIEDEFANSALYLRYAALLTLLDRNGYSLDSYIMIDPSDAPQTALQWEIIEAYEAALEEKPEHTGALQAQIIRLIELNNERLWPAFERLVQHDDSGERVRSIIDGLYSLDDISPVLRTLEDAVRKQPERASLRLNLAAAYLVDEQESAAKAELEKARSLVDDPLIEADIERMMLTADDPDFEARIGEIADKLSALNKLTTEEVDFLEDTIEKAPSFGEAYLLLARAYIGWDEKSAAMEALLDGQKHVANDPDILEMLARLLWDADEHDLAISYIQNGLVANPNHVPLLALAGRFLYDTDQVDAARGYLARAEAIAPRNPSLEAVRRYIAGLGD